MGALAVDNLSVRCRSSGYRLSPKPVSDGWLTGAVGSCNHRPMGALWGCWIVTWL